MINHRNDQKLTQELSGRFSVFPARMRTYHSWGWYLSISALLVWWAMKCESAVKLREQDNVCQDAVLFLGHVVVSVDGPLTVTLMLSSSHLMVCYISSNLKVIPMWPFFPVLHRVWGRRMIQRTHRKQLDLTSSVLKLLQAQQISHKSAKRQLFWLFIVAESATI